MPLAAVVLPEGDVRAGRKREAEFGESDGTKPCHGQRLQRSRIVEAGGDEANGVDLHGAAGEGDLALDWVALGILLYRLATGEQPFEGENPAAVLRAVIDNDYPDPEELCPEMGRGLGRILRTALAHDPQARYQTVAELLDALNRYLTEAGVEEPEELVRRWVEDEEECLALLRPSVIKSLKQAAQVAHSSGKASQALDLLGRVLFMDPDDREAAEMVRGARRRNTLRAALLGGCIALLAAAALLYSWPKGTSTTPAAALSRDGKGLDAGGGGSGVRVEESAPGDAGIRRGGPDLPERSRPLGDPGFQPTGVALARPGGGPRAAARSRIKSRPPPASPIIVLRSRRGRIGTGALGLRYSLSRSGKGRRATLRVSARKGKVHVGGRRGRRTGGGETATMLVAPGRTYTVLLESPGVGRLARRIKVPREPEFLRLVPPDTGRRAVPPDRASGNETRRLLVMVRPWARIHLGRSRSLVGVTPPPLRLDLAVGRTHLVRAVHDQAHILDRSVFIPATGRVPEIRAWVRFRDALLRITANIVADVLVDGKIRGTTAGTGILVVPWRWPRRPKATVQVKLVRRGFLPWQQDVMIQAGRTRSLTASLKRRKP